MNKRIIFLLVFIICCFIAFFFFSNSFSQFRSSKVSTYDIFPKDAQQIIINVKKYIVSGFNTNNEHDKSFVRASEELKENFSAIAFVGDNIFTIKNSYWLFFVKENTAHGAYIGKNYIAFVVLKKNEGYWETKDGGVFKR